MLRRLEALPIVLVGGQALNYWCNFYREQTPELRGGVFTSKDIDFQGSAEDFYESARLLNGKAEPTGDLQFLGYVLFDPDGRGDFKIDFLAFPTGLTATAVDSLAIRQPVGAAGVSARIMHPLHCMASRIENVVAAPDKYDNEHGLAQLRASIVCGREFIRGRLTAGDVRGALRDVEAVFKLCQERSALSVYRRRQVDPFLAVPSELPALSAPFRVRRLPQMRAALDRLRA